MKKTYEFRLIGKLNHRQLFWLVRVLNELGISYWEVKE